MTDETTTPRNFIDFDAFQAEQEEEPLVIRIGGVDYVLPGTVPAAAAIEGIRIQQAGHDQLPADRILRVAERLFGAEMLDEITTRHRLSVPQLLLLIKTVMDRYNAAAGVDGAPNQGNRATRRATRRCRSA